MDFSRYFNHLGSFQRFSPGSFRLSKNAPIGFAKKFNFIRNRTFLASVSLILGAFFAFRAHFLDVTEATLAWERSHFPSILIWKTALASEGLRELKDPRQTLSLFKSLPSDIEDGNQAWSSPDGAWVAVQIRAKNATLQNLFFCKSCDHPPGQWESAGRSWSAFETALQKAHRAPKAAIQAKKIDPWKDDREIRY